MAQDVEHVAEILFFGPDSDLVRHLIQKLGVLVDDLDDLVHIG